MSAPPDELAALPANLKANPRLGQWLSIRADGTVQVRSGKVDLGQGISVALAQIVADGLGVNIERVHMTPASTEFSPNEGVTSGSLSVQDSGSALRQVCVEARAIYLRAAASLWGLPHLEARDFQIADGQITWSDLSVQQDRRAGSRATSYWALADDALLAVDATGSAAPQGAPFAADVGGLAVGQSIPRRDIAGKVSGAPSFVHDLRLPGMLYGRVVHPPSSGAELESTDLARIDAMAGVVATVRDGNFLGVVAKGEFQAVQASERLAALSTWRETARLPAHQRLGEFLRTAPSETSVVGEKTAGARRRLEPASQTFKASYSRPFLAHASIGPSCAVAWFTPVGKDPLSGVIGDTLEVWCHAQGVYNLRADLALMLGLPARAITVQHVEGAGCYGHNGADDVAAGAALLARAMPGVPVQVVWSREDELACAPFGPAMAVDLQAELDADGRISNWQHEVWSNGHGLRPGRGKAPVLLAGTLLAKPFERQVSVNAPLAAGGGAERNAVPLYDFGQWKATSHRLLTMPVRSSALRSLGAHCNVFAVESFMDEIAHSAGVDPLAFRLKHLTDARAREVLQAVTGQAEWLARSGALPEGHGLGLAVTRYKNTGAYCAVVAQVDVSRDLRVTDLWLAADVGLVINPDGVVNQLEGGAIQTVSWVLKEAVQFDTTRITSRTWGHYPILKFTEVPRVHVRLLDRSEEKSVGAGEATHGPVAAAIANALFNATAVRVRDLPLTPERIRQVALAQ
jgi:CO/xanthine dehydrogenase Mo-binding subunit